MLDVAAWDGFFSFEAECPGAGRVVALDHLVWELDSELTSTAHFQAGLSKKVAKSVQCGEPDWTKVAGSSSGGLLFLPRGIGNSKKIKWLAKRSYIRNTKQKRFYSQQGEIRSGLCWLWGRSLS